MEKDLGDIRLFAAAAQKGGVREASLALGLPASTISRAITRLEKHAGVMLLERNARGVRLTDVGRDYLVFCEQALRQLQDGEDKLGAKLELRLNPAQAQKHRHFDPITLAVKDRHALDQWQKHLRRENIPRSPIIVAIQAWLIVVEDSDGNRIRFYTLETHGPELKPHEENLWLQN